MYAVIMAGGRGTRFWPSSRKAKPKQLLNVFGNETMLQITINRMKKLKCVEDIIIITGEDLAPQIRKRGKIKKYYYRTIRKKHCSCNWLSGVTYQEY